MSVCEALRVAEKLLRKSGGKSPDCARRAVVSKAASRGAPAEPNTGGSNALVMPRNARILLTNSDCVSERNSKSFALFSPSESMP